MSASNKAVKVTPREFINLFTYIFNNNEQIKKNGHNNVAVMLEGMHGLGKTSLVEQCAEMLGAEYIKVTMTNIDEAGEIAGIPTTQYYLQKGEEKRWVDKEMVDYYLNLNWEAVENVHPRMSYAIPPWVPKDKSKKYVINFDDVTRAADNVQQALMDVIQTGSYISWDLPPNAVIVATSNPDDGNYKVNLPDAAQDDRVFRAELVFEIESWAHWAEKNRIDGRCIYFLLNSPELISKNVSSRAATRFFLLLTTISDFKKQLPLIQMLGEGTVTPSFVSQFTTFIDNRLDRLISPEKIMTGKWAMVRDELISVIFDGANYRSEIASIISIRLYNYAYHYAKNNSITDAFAERLSQIFTAINDEGETIMKPDITYNALKNIYNIDPSKFRKLKRNQKIMKVLAS